MRVARRRKASAMQREAVVMEERIVRMRRMERECGVSMRVMKCRGNEGK